MDNYVINRTAAVVLDANLVAGAFSAGLARNTTINSVL